MDILYELIDWKMNTKHIENVSRDLWNGEIKSIIIWVDSVNVYSSPY